MGTAMLLASFGLIQGLIEPGATLHKLGTGYEFTEGPAVDRDGNVYFTDQPNDRILKWTADGSIAEWMKPAGRANGMTFDRKGNLIVCADGENELWSVAPDGTKTVLLSDFRGKLLNGPNDVWARPDNGLYFTDPLYARPYWKRDPAMQQPGQYVFYLSPDRKTLRPVITDLRQPNGIVGSKDGKYLFVSDIQGGSTFRYRIEPDGRLTDKSLACGLGSDGMTMDERGNLYLTGRGVSVYDRDGNKIQQIDVPEPWTANVAFGGKDRRTLFITASKSVYTIRMAVKGIE